MSSGTNAQIKAVWRNSVAEITKWKGDLKSVRNDFVFFFFPSILPYVLAKGVVEGTEHIFENLTFSQQISCVR